MDALLCLLKQKEQLKLVEKTAEERLGCEI